MEMRSEFWKSEIDNKGCIGFDLDGTLLEKGVWKSGLKNIINDLTSENFVFFATGRSILECGDIVDDIKVSVPVICDDGQYIYNREKRLYTENEYVNVNENDFILFDKNQIEIAIETRNNIYTESKILNKLLRIYCGIKEADIVHGVPKEHVHIYKIYYYERMEGSIDVLEKKYRITRIGKRFGSLTEQNVSKYTAFKKLARNRCIKTDNTIFFGDGKNDIELMSAVSRGVAMYNSVPELKKVSNYILNSDDELIQILLSLCDNKNIK